MRHNFSKRKNVLPLPNLSNVQLQSFDWLRKEGIQEILEELGTIKDYTGRDWVLKLSNSEIQEPNFTINEALRTGKTYDAPWYLDVEIEDPETGKSKKSKMYMGDIPIMTPTGTFILNGIERVVVNQITRSYGVLFNGEPSPSSNRFLGGAKILPKNGVWIDISTSRRGKISVKIDRRRKIAITTLLRIFGLETDEQIKAAFEHVDTNPEISYIEKTLSKDPSKSVDEAVLDVYRKMRPGEPLVLENAKELVDSMFFNKRRYSLGKVGRFRMNGKLGLDFPNEKDYWLLQLEDWIKIVERIIKMNNNEAEADDIDNLGNRRIRGVGELLQNEIRIGFLQISKNAKERMSLKDRDKLPDPESLISPRAVTAKIQGFLASGRLSQYQDQQNPLTALDHLRRVSVSGPGGLTKERASMEVRDVHYTHYGRICPVRTPEGPNIGLITYLAMYSRVNEFGFLETPYFKLKEEDGKVKVTDDVVYLAAYDEKDAYITDSSVEVDEDGYIVAEQVPLRKGGNFMLGDVKNADYVEVVPRQIVGISAGMIPFIENNDVSRSLIATQQMSQAVPLVKPEAPIVGTGIEEVVANNAGAVIRAERKGTVSYADGERIEVNYEGKRANVVYPVKKFIKSNQDTSFTQTVRVETGDEVNRGDILIEGPASQDGELAIGTNMKIAYMIWDGYEYEDGIVLSDRIVKDDILTSVHISDYDVQVLETKLGPEEITRDIPNVSEDTLRNLDEDGIVAIGSKVKSGDILVGKVAPKGETELSSEERLLRAIFGEKAKDVRNNSLRMPHGEHGTVIGIKRVTREENKDLQPGVLEEITVYVVQKKKIEVGDKLAGRHGNKGVISAIVPEVDMPRMEDGTPIDIVFSSEAVLKRMNVGQLLEVPLGFAGRKLNKKYAVPVFESPEEEEIAKELEEAGLSPTGKVKLIDGRTGEAFENEVVVGESYILKLIHLGEEKMHARSTGPYSLITQQPLGGKSQFGGQRLGEMEVWALEAYGAAHVLREMLTIKSDDIIGRSRAYKAILKGEEIPDPTIPESFKLAVREMNGLGIAVDAIGGEEEPAEKEDSSEEEDK